MSGWMIALVGLIYAVVAADFAYKGNYWMAVVFFGYALSNIGLYKLANP